jgi:DNA repair protein RadC
MSTPDSIDYYPTIKDLPSGDRPRERLIREGATALSTAELLAIILRVGVDGENVISLSQRLLAGVWRSGRAGPRPVHRPARQRGLGGGAKVATLEGAVEIAAG